MEWPESNPEHWESLSLGVHNEDLLGAMGGSWDGPPDLPPHWAHSAAVLAGGQGRRLLQEAYPNSGPSVWKDPRLCILLPYWRTILDAPIAAVLVWRHPLAVAHSLQRRDGLPLPLGIALWERYNRSAVDVLSGVDTYVVDYDDVTADPRAFIADCGGWIGSLEQFAETSPEWDLGRATGSVVSELRHEPSRFSDRAMSLVPAEAAALASALAGMAGGHRPFDPGPASPESAWSTAIVATRREVALQRREAEAATRRFWTERAWLAARNLELSSAYSTLAETQWQLAVARAQLETASEELAALRQSTSWRATEPLRASLARVDRWRRGDRSH